MCLLKDHIRKWVPKFKDSMQQFYDTPRPYQAEYVITVDSIAEDFLIWNNLRATLDDLTMSFQMNVG
jgi:TorA maturation chaperone TorD